jgi:flagellar biosynthesis/type III secretory pathway M-ring protein FliF/YscJ
MNKSNTFGLNVENIQRSNSKLPPPLVNKVKINTKPNFFKENIKGTDWMILVYTGLLIATFLLIIWIYKLYSFDARKEEKTHAKEEEVEEAEEEEVEEEEAD